MEELKDQASKQCIRQGRHDRRYAVASSMMSGYVGREAPVMVSYPNERGQMVEVRWETALFIACILRERSRDDIHCFRLRTQMVSATTQIYYRYRQRGLSAVMLWTSFHS